MMIVSLPNANVGIYNQFGYVCQDVQDSGLSGQIEPAVCSILSELNVSKQCGCVSPPANDACAGAIAVPVGDTIVATTVNASWDSDQVCPLGNFTNYYVGVWYKFIGTGKPIKVDTCKFSFYDTYLSVSVGADCGSLNCAAASSSGFCGKGARVTLYSAKGETYYVLVQSLIAGDFELEVTDVIPPELTLTVSPTAPTVSLAPAPSFAALTQSPPPITSRDYPRTVKPYYAPRIYPALSYLYAKPLPEPNPFLQTKVAKKDSKMKGGKAKNEKKGGSDKASKQKI